MILLNTQHYFVLYDIFVFLVPKHTGSFYLDVERKLNHLITNEDSLKVNTFSPYGYKLDFEVTLSNPKRSIHRPTKNEKYGYILSATNLILLNRLFSRIAILLLNEKHLRKVDNEMRGYARMKQRHLEILGYRVIWIKKSFWNSMFMAEPEAKLSYLKSLLRP